MKINELVGQIAKHGMEAAMAGEGPTEIFISDNAGWLPIEEVFVEAGIMYIRAGEPQ